MRSRQQRLVDLARYLPLATMMSVISLLPWHRRVRVVSAVAQALLPKISFWKNRVLANFQLVFPDLSDSQHRKLLRQYAHYSGILAAEIWFPGKLASTSTKFRVDHNGLDRLLEVHRSGQGILLLTGHFGQWEAVRHVLKLHEVECVGLYRPLNNAYFNAVFERQMNSVTPPYTKGMAGNKWMIKTLVDGGVFMLLPDQAYMQGAVLQFMGQRVRTATSAAEVALRKNALVIPAYGTRLSDTQYQVDFEPPLTGSTGEEIMQQFNDSLEARVRKHPEQYNWLHRRWKGF